MMNRMTAGPLNNRNEAWICIGRPVKEGPEDNFFLSKGLDHLHKISGGNLQQG
jgi:hypothetical protein